MFYIPMGVLLVCVAMQQSLFVSGLFWEFLTIIVSADRLISFSLTDRWTIRLGPFSRGPFKQPAGPLLIFMHSLCYTDTDFNQHF